MPHEHIHYELQDGFIHTWLVTGPRHTPIEADADLETSLGRLESLVKQAEQTGHELDLTGQPVEPSTPSEGEVKIGDYTGQWAIVHCMEDHFVDLSDATQRGRMTAWAYTGLHSTGPQRVSFTLTTTDLTDVWVNGAYVHRELRTSPDPILSGSRHVSGTFEVLLKEGINDVVVRFATVAPGPTPFVLALHVAGEESLQVTLTTLISPVDRRNRLEAAFRAAYMKQYVFTRHETILIAWPDKVEGAEPIPPDAEATVSMSIRGQTPAGRIYAEADRMGGAGETAEIGFAYQYPNGPLDAFLMPRPVEYYEGNMRVNRAIPFWGLDSDAYTETPVGTFPERRKEALLSAARREATIYSEIAKMAVGWWSRLEKPLIEQAVRAVSEQGPAIDYVTLLGLIGMLARFGENESFPEEQREPIAEAILNADYRATETTPGQPESRVLLSAVCEILAGQLYPEVTFKLSGESGEWHQAQGEARALDWIHTRATRGFQDAGSDTVYSDTVLALAHVIDLANSDALWEMGAVLLDKVLFLIGCNSYKGIFGSARGWTTTPALLGGYLEATSGIAKLMWGTGVNNTSSAAPVSLALLENYELPVMLQAVATDTPESLWSQEHHDPQETGTPSNSTNTVSYKTPDFMLSAAQDALPGQPGSDEHIWQATLGPGATVFVNHPVCAGLSDAQRPNFWRGNGVRPRVAQWQDALIALYALPADDWMGFTHAYFPVHAFDEYVLRDGWAFARKHDGYIALTASGGVDLVTTGHSAFRELRSPGLRNVWLCQMGRKALDGDFKAFQSRVLALSLDYTALDMDGFPGVRWTTLRGDELELAWTGSFLRNGEDAPVSTDRHIDNGYCVAEFPAQVLDIHYDETVMRLTFDKP
jgi:hypothetical protein